MKKWMVVAMALSIGVLSQVGAMTSETLLQNPDRYRVIATEGNKIFYADTKDMKSMQTRDFPNSIERLIFPVYVEVYKDSISAMDYQNHQEVAKVEEGTAVFFANKREGVYSGKVELSDQTGYSWEQLPITWYATASRYQKASHQ